MIAFASIFVPPTHCCLGLVINRLNFTPTSKRPLNSSKTLLFFQLCISFFLSQLQPRQQTTMTFARV